MSKYRARIYSQYVDTFDENNVPASLQDFANRAPTLRHVVDTFFPEDKAAHILDLGCGHGALVHFAHQSGYFNTNGVDVSAQQVELAHKLGIAKIVRCDLMAALEATTPSSLDAVVSFDVIEHFTKDELIDIADAVHHALKPSGRWIIHAPNATSPFVGAIRYGDFTHEQAFTASSLQQLLKATGYSNIVYSECRPRVHGLKSLLRLLLWSLVKGVLKLSSAAETGDLGTNAIWTRNIIAVAYR
jgi:2-polyprenyl-3-methyl-5-hydroxy-6-metoxy-1,4-benzoquinol methylase